MAEHVEQATAAPGEVRQLPPLTEVHLDLGEGHIDREEARRIQTLVAEALGCRVWVVFNRVRINTNEVLTADGE